MCQHTLDLFLIDLLQKHLHLYPHLAHNLRVIAVLPCLSVAVTDVFERLLLVFLQSLAQLLLALLHIYFHFVFQLFEYLIALLLHLALEIPRFVSIVCWCVCVRLVEEIVLKYKFFRYESSVSIDI